MPRAELFILIFAIAASAAADDTGSYRFVIMGDRSGGPRPGVFEAIIDTALKTTPAPAFFINVGDLIGGYTRDTAEVIRQWKEVTPLLDRVKSKFPLHLLPGNHDITYPGLEPFYERFCGERNCSFDQGPDHFVLLDVSTLGDFNGMPTTQRAWLEKDLNEHSRARHTFVFSHIPFWNVSPVQKSVDSQQAFYSRNGVDFVVNGHNHNYRYGKRGNVTYVIVGSSGGAADNKVADGSAFHYAVVDVNAKGARFTPVLLDGRRMTQEWVDTARASLIKKLSQQIFAYAPLDWRPEKGISRDTLRASVKNPLKTALPVLFSWSKPDGCAWKIEPDSALVALVKPNGSYAFSCAMASGKILPLPRLSARYVFENDTFNFEQSQLLQRSMNVARVKPGEVTTDGILNESAWKLDRAASTHWFGNEGSRGDSTWVGLAFDDKNFYMAFECPAPDSSKITVRTPAAKRDGISMTDDHIRVYLAADVRALSMRQFFFAPNGALNDHKVRSDGENWVDSAAWDGLSDYKVTWDKSGYRGEAVLPLKELGFDPGKGMVFNFRRYAEGSEYRTSYQEPYEREPAKFAKGK